ncbi:MAG: glycoside hydrolase, partial [Victivallales bacterium]|nr:glycoside hydrolase [Victivallales bacterium]
WPTPVASGRLYSPAKPGVPHGPLTLAGPFPEATKLRLHLHQVSSKATLVVQADDQPVWRREYVCGPGEGEWTTAIHAKKWDMYQNIYDKDYTIDIPAGTRQIQVEMAAGDWLILSELGVTPEGQKEVSQALNGEWGVLPATLAFTPDGPIQSTRQHDGNELWEKRIGVWDGFRRAGIGAMVGEFGVFNKTPHAVSLAWLEDNLKQLKKANLGWALWNLRGGFGILDSGRKDVEYEDFQGHQLDRKMLELLQQY